MVRYFSVQQRSTYCTEAEITFHYYPEDTVARKKWLARLRNDKEPSKNAMGCSKHFADDAFVSVKKNRAGECLNSYGCLFCGVRYFSINNRLREASAYDAWALFRSSLLLPMRPPIPPYLSLCRITVVLVRMAVDMPLC